MPLTPAARKRLKDHLGDLRAIEASQPALPPKPLTVDEEDELRMHKGFASPSLRSTADQLRVAETPLQIDAARDRFTRGTPFAEPGINVPDTPVDTNLSTVITEPALEDLELDPLEHAQRTLDRRHMRQAVSRYGAPSSGTGIKDPITGEVTDVKMSATLFQRGADPEQRKRAVELIQSGMTPGAAPPPPGGLRDITKDIRRFSKDIIQDFEIKDLGRDISADEIDQVSKILADDLGGVPGARTALEQYLADKSKPVQDVIRYNKAVAQAKRDPGVRVDPDGTIIFTSGEEYKPGKTTPGAVPLKGKALQDRIDVVTGKKSKTPATPTLTPQQANKQFLKNMEQVDDVLKRIKGMPRNQAKVMIDLVPDAQVKKILLDYYEKGADSPEAVKSRVRATLSRDQKDQIAMRDLLSDDWADMAPDKAIGHVQSLRDKHDSAIARYQAERADLAGLESTKAFKEFKPPETAYGRLVKRYRKARNLTDEEFVSDEHLSLFIQQERSALIRRIGKKGIKVGVEAKRPAAPKKKAPATTPKAPVVDTKPIPPSTFYQDLVRRFIASGDIDRAEVIKLGIKLGTNLRERSPSASMEALFALIVEEIRRREKGVVGRKRKKKPVTAPATPFPEGNILQSGLHGL